MTDTAAAPPAPAPETGAGAPAPPSDSTRAGQVSVPRWAALLFVLLALAAAAASGMLWQKLHHIQEELARRSADAGTQAVEARTLAKQAEDQVRETAARLALAETRLSEVALQRSQLEELMQSLSRSRDENLVVDIESALRLAQQQAQLTGSIEPLIAALKTAEQRVLRAAQPRLNPLARAMGKDLERLRSAAVADVPSLLSKLDELARLADELPLANAVAAAPAPAPRASAARSAANPWLAWWDNAVGVLRGEAERLLRVSRIDQPEAALLAPEQSFFLRENLKLKVLNARLAVLARQFEAARADLAASLNLIGKYGDPASRKTQSALQLLQQLQLQTRNTELPRLDNTLTALATAAAGR